MEGSLIISFIAIAVSTTALLGGMSTTIKFTQRFEEKFNKQDKRLDALEENMQKQKERK